MSYSYIRIRCIIPLLYFQQWSSILKTKDTWILCTLLQIHFPCRTQYDFQTKICMKLSQSPLLQILHNLLYSFKKPTNLPINSENLNFFHYSLLITLKPFLQYLPNPLWRGSGQKDIFQTQRSSKVNSSVERYLFFSNSNYYSILILFS